ncbi:Zn-dependent peptidase ImmA, M78 family [Paraburkholderia phenazinium]|uniref:Zn-dependent peptidase ImmA, M78 family n=1 Tax=Paraburkholderia phenazinium TaxID=60549 RepID=A0A1G7NUW1_9BURK|nr:ImmA/IrrE family metallo-endopeptidase [Paraburkholderia phenazinium]SDF77825.1 Zn-dependent peptidase ImmA, M78 family [Paraburkholderia phenazinium]
MDEAQVQQCARNFISDLEIKDVRDDLSVYVKAANAKVVKEELGKGESGYTITKPNGKHVITVNSLEPEERQRFTICHEIAHIELKLPSSHEEVPSWSYAKRHINEVMCDIFAAELLMPYVQWRALVPKTEPSLDVLEYMASQFRTSFPAAASRYANLADVPCAYVTMERGAIRYAARSTLLRKVGAWIAPKSPIPPGSVAHRLREGGVSQVDTGEVAQDIWFENWDKGLDLSELARHYAKSDTTVALLWFSEEDLPEVETTRFGARVVEDDGLSELTGELTWPGRNRRR